MRPHCLSDFVVPTGSPYNPKPPQATSPDCGQDARLKAPRTKAFIMEKYMHDLLSGALSFDTV